MKSEPTLRFLPQSDGKTPLFMWIMIPLFKIFQDPLFAGRFLSVLSGLSTLIGIFLLSWKFFNPLTGLWAAFLYAIVPYTLFFDRMALVDSMLSAFTLWSLLFALLLVQNLRLDLAMILGYFLGGALLTKTPAMFNLLVLPFSILAFNFKKFRSISFAKLLFYWIVAIVIAMGMYNILRLGSNFQMLSARNADYVFSPSDLQGRPLDPFLPHLGDMIEWGRFLTTWPVIFMIGLGIGFMLYRKHRAGIAVLLWLLIPVLVQMAFLKTFTARYLLSAVVPLLVLAGYGLTQVIESLKFSKKINFMGIFVIALVVSITPLYTDYMLLTKPEDAKLPKNERRGYFEDWTAGYGFPKIAEFLIEKKKTGKVVVGTEGSFGTLPDGLQIYLDKSGIPIIGGNSTISAKLRETAKDNTTFFVANKNRVGENIKNANLVMEFIKAKPLDDRFKQDAIVVYQVYPE